MRVLLYAYIHDYMYCPQVCECVSGACSRGRNGKRNSYLLSYSDNSTHAHTHTLYYILTLSHTLSPSLLTLTLSHIGGRNDKGKTKRTYRRTESPQLGE